MVMLVTEQESMQNGQVMSARYFTIHGAVVLRRQELLHSNTN
jgi:hypothetical protein